MFYQPGALGLEGERRAGVLERREAQVASLFEAESPFEAASGAGGESFVWSKDGEGKREWRSRAEGSTPARLALLRKALYDIAAPARDDRVLVLDAREGYLVWEGLRRCPEGTVAAAARDAGEADLIDALTGDALTGDAPTGARALEAAFGFASFDLAVGRDLFYGRSCPLLSPREMLQGLARALPGAALVLAQTLPREGGRISDALERQLEPELLGRLREFELAFYARTDLPGLGPERAELEASIRASGIELELAFRRESYPRRLSGPELDAWLGPASAFGCALAQRISPSEMARIASAAELASRRGSVDWPLAVLYVVARLPPTKA